MKIIATNSRAGYFKEYRKKNGQFSVSIEKDKLEKLTIKLESMNQTKTSWLNAKINEELNSK